MASGHTGNVVPGNRLRVRVPCPPLLDHSVGLVNGISATEATEGSNRGWDSVFRSIDDHNRSPPGFGAYFSRLVHR